MAGWPNEEGGRRKEEGGTAADAVCWSLAFFLLPPSSFLLPPSSFLLPPSSFLWPPSSGLLPLASFLWPPSSGLLPMASSVPCATIREPAARTPDATPTPSSTTYRRLGSP